MAVKTTEQLKSAFSAGKYPTAEDYSDLIDSLAGGSGIETFTSSSNMFDSSKPVGSIEVFVNGNSYTETISVYDGSGSSINITVAPYGATPFIKYDDSNNYWLPLGLPIQQGGSNGDNQGS